MLGSSLCSIPPTQVCVSLDEPELVDSVLTFLSRYDTLEYSWVKATVVSVCLRILFVTLQSTNKLSGASAGERQLHYLRTQSSSYPFSFSFFLPLPLLPMEQPIFSRLSYPPGEFWKPSSSSNPFLSANREPRPAFIAMVRTRLLFGSISEDPGDHLRVFEGLCLSLVILGMTQEAMRWKLFTFSLTERASNGTPAR